VAGVTCGADHAVPAVTALIYGSACLTVAALSSLLGGGVLQVSPHPCTPSHRCRAGQPARGQRGR
jgi:hypothetical protein